MKKILVMGGTGAMGKYLVPMLVENPDYQVFVTSRSERSSDLSNLTYLQGNAMEWGWIKTVLDSHAFDVVFDFMMYSAEAFQQRHLGLLDRCDHYFYFSTYRVLAEEATLTEDSPRKLDQLDSHPEYRLDSYGVKKAKGEDVLHHSGRSNYTIIRPSMTFSDNRFQFFSGDNFDVVRAAKGVPTLLPETAVNSLTSLTYGKDVARMLAALVGKEAAKGQVFHTVTKPLTWGEIGQAFHTVFGMTYKVIPDKDYLSLIELKDGRILDRFRRRNISTEKVFSVTGLSNSDFASLEDNLKEAWASSDQGRYRNGRGSIAAMARFDHLSHSRIDLKGYGSSLTSSYAKEQKRFSKKTEISGFYIVPNPACWSVRKGGFFRRHIQVARTGGQVTDDGWLSFRNYGFLHGLEKGANYTLSIDLAADATFELKFFMHLYKHSVFRLPEISVKAGRHRYSVRFQLPERCYSDLTITATELAMGTRFRLYDLSVTREA